MGLGLGRVRSWSWLGRRLVRLRHDGSVLNGSPLRRPVRTGRTGSGPGRQERERSEASPRPAARPDSLDLLDLVGVLGVRFLPNQGGSVSNRAPGHLATARLDLHQAQTLQVGTPGRETPAPPPWLRPWPC